MKNRVVIAIAIAGMLLGGGAGAVDAGCADTPYLGEICTFAGSYCPQNFFVPAAGQVLPIDGDNAPLFSLLGTSFGGDGITTFALPDLRGAIVVGTGALAGSSGAPLSLGQTGGGVTTATVLAGNDTQAPAGPLPFVGLTQCIAIAGVFPERP
jgi:microcystin-dependent protein